MGHTIEADGCWRFTGAIASNGYGRMGVRGQKKTAQAHRQYWEQKHGSVPAGYELDHLCRHRWCVNPGHLEVVTRQENAWRGAKSFLTWEQVRAIRACYARGGINQQGIATAYGIGKSTVGHILSGTRWIEP